MSLRERFWHHFSMIGVYFKYNVQAELEYPLHLIAWFISNPLQVLFGIITVNVVVSNFSSLAGWDFPQIAFLYGLGVISHGLSILLFIQTWGMDYFVTEGWFDLLMTRPLNVYFQFCFLLLNFIGFTDLLPGVVVFIYGCAAVHFDFNLLNTLKLIATIIGATLIRGGMFTITSSLAFWIKRSGRLIQVQLSIVDFTQKYPMSIYPRAMQLFFTIIIPFGFICFYPAAEFLDKTSSFSIPGSLSLWTLGIGIAVYLIGMALFNLGLRRYESAGS